MEWDRGSAAPLSWMIIHRRGQQCLDTVGAEERRTSYSCSQSSFCSLARPVSVCCLPAAHSNGRGGSRIWVLLRVVPPQPEVAGGRGTLHEGRENSQTHRSEPLLQDVNVDLLEWDLKLFAVWRSHTLTLLKLSHRPVVDGHPHQPLHKPDSTLFLTVQTTIEHPVSFWMS